MVFQRYNNRRWLMQQHVKLTYGIVFKFVDINMSRETLTLSLLNAIRGKWSTEIV